MQQMLLNGKLGAVCTQLYELYDLFGVRTEEGMLIDFRSQMKKSPNFVVFQLLAV